MANTKSAELGYLGMIYEIIKTAGAPVAMFIVVVAVFALLGDKWLDHVIAMEVEMSQHRISVEKRFVDAHVEQVEHVKGIHHEIRRMNDNDQ
jgi:hypothetical protein